MSADRERELLWLLLMRPGELERARKRYVPDALRAERHRLILRAIYDSSATNPEYPTTVGDLLRERGQLAEVGGWKYLAELVSLPLLPGDVAERIFAEGAA